MSEKKERDMDRPIAADEEPVARLKSRLALAEAALKQCGKLLKATAHRGGS